MKSDTESTELKPLTPFIRYGEGGRPYLVGSRCGGCGTVFTGERSTCAKCAARGLMESIELGASGRLYNFTVVHRSFPGVKTPFVSAIVELDGGGSLKGNLIDVEPDPDKLTFDMPVDVVFADAGKADREGGRYLTYFFKPQAPAVRP